MLAKSRKENNIDEETKSTIPKSTLKAKVKAREFGRELTNNLNQDSKKGKTSAKLPKTSAKIAKLQVEKA